MLACVLTLLLLVPKNLLACKTGNYESGEDSAAIQKEDPSFVLLSPSQACSVLTVAFICGDLDTTLLYDYSRANSKFLEKAPSITFEPWKREKDFDYHILIVPALFVNDTIAFVETFLKSFSLSSLEGSRLILMLKDITDGAQFSQYRLAIASHAFSNTVDFAERDIISTSFEDITSLVLEFRMAYIQQQQLKIWGSY